MIIIPKNTGKIFEESWRKSIPNDIYYYRLRDQASSFGTNSALRFTLQNPYDILMYIYPQMYCLELKSVQGTSMSYWSERFEDKSKKQTFIIKKNQILGLREASKHHGIVPGFILNWRKTNHTYFLHIGSFDEMILDSDKKSFSENDVIENNGILIEQKLLKTNYRYDVKKFISDTNYKEEPCTRIK